MPKLAKQLGFALIRHGEEWRLYTGPTQIFVARDGAELVESLRQVEDHARRGGEAVALLCYEAGYALEARLLPLLSQSQGSRPLFNN
jgi:hypothetical protein